MTVAGWVALAITIFGAFGYAAASILQAVGARRSTGTMRTLGHPLYLIGTACDVLAWAGSMIALRELAVYLVESVLAGSLAVTVVAARLFLKSRLRKRDIAATVVSVAALTVLAMSAGPQESVAASSGLRLWFCAAALATAVIGWGSAKAGSPGVVAAVAGLCLGGAALAGRALSLPAEPMEHVGATALAVITEPLVAALVIFAATGMLLYTHALQHGQVGPVTAVLWIAEVIAPSAVALVLLGDAVRPGWELAAPRLLCCWRPRRRALRPPNRRTPSLRRHDHSRSRRRRSRPRSGMPSGSSGGARRRSGYPRAARTRP